MKRAWIGSTLQWLQTDRLVPCPVYLTSFLVFLHWCQQVPKAFQSTPASQDVFCSALVNPLQEGTGDRHPVSCLVAWSLCPNCSSLGSRTCARVCREAGHLLG